MKLYTKFQDYAKNNPQGIALVHGDKTITYGELDKKSSLVADTIKHLGIKKGQRVAICLPKSIEFVICMLAALKSETIYVPVDYQQPDNRINYILKNCSVSILFFHLDSKKNLSLPPSLEACIGIKINENKLQIDISNSSAFVTAKTNNENLAFLLYTSGSTGTPKGVKISHSNAQFFVNWCLQTFQVTDNDSLLSLAGFHFDLSVFDIYVTLSVGAKLILFPRSIINPNHICQVISDHRISILYCVPSILTLLVSSKAIYEKPLNSIRYILFAGEVFPIKYLRQLKSCLPTAQFYNLYGPTETNVCTYYKVSSVGEDKAQTIPIGKAIEGIKVYALGKNNQLIQPGEQGELYVTGECVTPGYWEHYDKVNFQNHRQQIHATGDLVTLKGDEYVFCGRKDHQIKLRGYRIELSEVETAILQSEYVKECVVLFEERKARLVAYVSGNMGNLNTIYLKLHCAKYIPNYMVPCSFKIMNEIPKNSNGKADRVQLQKSENKYSNGSCCIEIQENTISFSNGNESFAIHPLWLRERCNCQKCLDPATKQRLYSPSSGDLDVNIASACFNTSHKIELSFSDGHQGLLEPDALIQENQVCNRWRKPIKSFLWDAKIEKLPQEDYNDINVPEDISRLTQKIAIFGFVLIKGAPCDKDELERFAQKFGPIDDTNFGKVFDIQFKIDGNDLSYKPQILAPHTDSPYRRPAPGIEFLHSVENSVKGGNSTLVDGFRVAEELKKINPEGFKVLTTTKVRFYFSDSSYKLENWAPIIQIEHGKYQRITFHDRVDYVPLLDPSILSIFYQARKQFFELLTSPDFEIRFRLESGMIMVLDNHRMVHGRTAYSLESGTRYLNGCHMSRYNVDSKLP
ncbi:amino acid adenylation domain-containing protein [Candidatus Uabimicrobium sp. HlEnr_7]|uniref:amino acid adenylation domain-containing protein n=1 Tax=Candidatus Uabimicrobium helgolandensis TaxID=3095367 RepID=UPI0035586828